MIQLPWPPPELSPNARVHFRVKAKAAKAYREQAFWIASAAKCPVIPSDAGIALHIEFRPPDKRRRDLDNMLASTKAALDGIADALMVDDHRFSLHLKRGEPVKGGKVLACILAVGAA